MPVNLCDRHSRSVKTSAAVHRAPLIGREHPPGERRAREPRPWSVFKGEDFARTDIESA